MQLSPWQLRPSGKAVQVDGPKGPVRLALEQGRITARYTGRQLVNGSANAYAAALKSAALELAQSVTLPWSTDADGCTRITDHERFYVETFSPQVLAIETLRRWVTGV